MTFFESNKVKIFPCYSRGSFNTATTQEEASADVPTQAQTVVFDPEARLITETNFTSIMGNFLGQHSYIVEVINKVINNESQKLTRVVINGYYFEIKDFVFSEGQTLWIKLEPIVLALASNTEGEDSERITYSLASLDTSKDTSKGLDAAVVTVEGNTETSKYYCYAIGYTDSRTKEDTLKSLQNDKTCYSLSYDTAYKATVSDNEQQVHLPNTNLKVTDLEYLDSNTYRSLGDTIKQLYGADLPDENLITLSSLNAGKVARVAGKDGTAIIVDNIDSKNPEIGLTIDTSDTAGNVKLSQAAAGLSANIDLSAYKIDSENEDKYKQLQTSVDATATEANTFVDTIAQNANGEVAITTKAVDFSPVIGTDDDTKDNDTIKGAKAYAKGLVDGIPAQTDYTVTYSDEEVAATETTGAFKRHTLTQNGQTVCTIDIPRDLVIKSGRVDAETDELVLVLINDEEIRVDVSHLIEYVTGATAADGVITINISDDFVATATINDGTITSAKFAEDVDIYVDDRIDDKINALDVTDITGFNASKTLATLTETDGKISATFRDIAITKSQVTDFNEADYKKVQAAVVDPTVDPTTSGTGTEFIASITQDEQGIITATKKAVDFSNYYTKKEADAADADTTYTVEATENSLEFEVTPSIGIAQTVALKAPTVGKDSLDEELKSIINSLPTSENITGLADRIETLEASSHSPYEHPRYFSDDYYNSNASLYKVVFNESGHIIAYTPVQKEDIIDLGLPGENTTYEVATTEVSGLMSKEAVQKLNAAITTDNYLEKIPAATVSTSGLMSTEDKAIVVSISETLKNELNSLDAKLYGETPPPADRVSLKLLETELSELADTKLDKNVVDNLAEDVSVSLSKNDEFVSDVASKLDGTTFQVFAVAFDANGGKGIMQPQVSIGESYKLPECSFDPCDFCHVFKGWGTSADAETPLDVDTEYTLTANTIFYALWTAQHIEGETVVENKVDATCTTDGRQDNVVYCTECNKELSRNTVTFPATGHSYNAVVTDPTCTEQGYTTYTCSDCGDTYIDDYTAALGHSYEDGSCTKCSESEPAESPDNGEDNSENVTDPENSPILEETNPIEPIE